MLATNEFELGELTSKLEIHLIDTKASWLKHIFKKNIKNLENYCNNIAVKYSSLIFNADNFISLSESALVSFLERGDLQMKEVEIWNYVIKWGTKFRSNDLDLRELNGSWNFICYILGFCHKCKIFSTMKYAESAILSTTTNYSLHFTTVKDTSWKDDIYLESGLKPSDRGSSISHVITIHESTSDFLMMCKLASGVSLEELIKEGGLRIFNWTQNFVYT
ncbi:hypothetical protein Glove_117g126 [Diversispora epigaea]|uniref:BACK domain-containing protein n=1 Tax=Diversispora epigaea TaxID=1348612 RepID=A0A397J0B9_9GLOM|nr:hypothetical protein Glove_117g126 [Diversispora epigaea]